MVGELECWKRRASKFCDSCKSAPATLFCRANSVEEAGDHGAGSGKARSRTDYGEDGGGNGAGGADLECVQYDEDPETWNR